MQGLGLGTRKKKQGTKKIITLRKKKIALPVIFHSK